jgi:hypothetical protein
MQMSPVHLALEGEVARAHRALYRAGANADQLNMQDLAFELEAMRDELEIIQVFLLKGGARRVPS